MDSQIIAWLSAVSGTVLRVCGTLFILVNGLAIGAFMLKRDRSMVQRWTSPWLAANLLLIGAGRECPWWPGSSNPPWPPSPAVAQSGRADLWQAAPSRRWR